MARNRFIKQNRSMCVHSSLTQSLVMKFYLALVKKKYKPGIPKTILKLQWQNYLTFCSVTIWFPPMNTVWSPNSIVWGLHSVYSKMKGRLTLLAEKNIPVKCIIVVISWLTKIIPSGTSFWALRVCWVLGAFTHPVSFNSYTNPKKHHCGLNMLGDLSLLWKVK